MFNCTTKSITIDARMAKAKAEPSLVVKVAVYVMKPGPMAEVAIRKMAAVRDARRDFANSTLWASLFCSMDFLLIAFRPSRMLCSDLGVIYKIVNIVEQ